MSKDRQRTTTFKDIDDARGAELQELWKRIFGGNAKYPKKAVAEVRQDLKDELERQDREASAKAAAKAPATAAAKAPVTAAAKAPTTAAAKAPAKDNDADEAPPPRRAAPPVVKVDGAEGYGYRESEHGQFYVVSPNGEEVVGPYDSEGEAEGAIRKRLSRRDAIKEAAAKIKEAAAKAEKLAKAEKPAKAEKLAKADGAGRETQMAFIRETILAGRLRVDEIVSAVQEKFPGSGCTQKDVYWHKWKMGKEGIQTPAWPAKPKAAAAEAEATK
jgi:hypothetical protein